VLELDVGSESVRVLRFRKTLIIANVVIRRET
jgi:hypothetical protein